jgi:hypothetical protein
MFLTYSTPGPLPMPTISERNLSHHSSLCCCFRLFLFRSIWDNTHSRSSSVNCFRAVRTCSFVSLILAFVFGMSVHSLLSAFSLPHNFAIRFQWLKTFLCPDGDEGTRLSHNQGSDFVSIVKQPLGRCWQIFAVVGRNNLNGNVKGAQQPLNLDWLGEFV